MTDKPVPQRKCALIRRFLPANVFMLIFVLLAFGVAESADLKKKKIGVSLSYRSKLSGDFNTEKLKLNHPIKISREEIIHHLVSLRYKGTFLGDKEEPVFSPPEVQKLAPVLVRAFAGLTPEKIIHMKLKSADRVTSGDIFSFKNHLNWRFDSIHGETFLQRNDIRAWNVFAWKLMPQDGQRYFKSGAEKGKRIRENWIVSKLNLPVTGKGKPDHGGVQDSYGGGGSSLEGNINPELEKKLEHLKHLYDRDLINEEEYKAQQKKLFEELF